MIICRISIDLNLKTIAEQFDHSCSSLILYLSSKESTFTMIHLMGINLFNKGFYWQIHFHNPAQATAKILALYPRRKPKREGILFSIEGSLSIAVAISVENFVSNRNNEAFQPV
ncbi:hypothetical protein GWI33_019840 [Rhynchophorus ferrugineus]|uniref:Uncharacterized protein n=1 Tax=Rhynchophorus ferrugineus TaxID=354439 RepID=A0A834HSX8_RHYFE|nr:hypothetical protein GWI33_019840 [Rhynchophorus ferrugineus]